MENFPVKISVSRDKKDQRMLFLSVESELRSGDNENEKRMKTSRVFGMLNMIAINMNAVILNIDKAEPFSKTFENEIRYINWLRFGSAESAERFVSMVKEIK